LLRRDFLTGLAASAVWTTGTAAATPLADIPVIDSHIHLFDATRPQGAPYTGSRDYQGGISSPALYRAAGRPLGIVGAVVIEASSWIEDNLWALEQVQSDTMMLGFVGDFKPEDPAFPQYLARYQKNKLFRGIRYGNNWRYDLVGQMANPALFDGLKLLSQADLSLDTANPRVDLLQAMVTINDRLPDLRIVLDHLPFFEPTPQNQADYNAVLRDIHSRPNIYVKLSEIYHRVNGIVMMGLAAHRDRMDMLMGVFGEDRVIFGSDAQQEAGVATLPEIVGLVREYFSTQPHTVAEKFFWKNSAVFYKWVRRASDQPSLV